MRDSEIRSLSDLRKIRTAPGLDRDQEKNLSIELDSYIRDADWFTIGIMAPSFETAVFTLKDMEARFSWSPMNLIRETKEEGPVFLKANQKTGDVYLRIEYGLGEGVLLSCQYEEEGKFADTLGPFPLDFFKIKY